MPLGDKNWIEISVAVIPALSAMKVFDLNGRDKVKDAYNVYYCVRNHGGELSALAEDRRPLLEDKEAVVGFMHIASKFDSVEHYGPHEVGRFAEETGILEERSREPWRVDAHGQVEAWLNAMGRIKVS